MRITMLERELGGKLPSIQRYRGFRGPRSWSGPEYCRVDRNNLLILAANPVVRLPISLA